MEWIDSETHGSLQTIREGFVPRRRALVFCSAMGKNLAGTLTSGEKPGDKMGPFVLERHQPERLRTKDGAGVDQRSPVLVLEVLDVSLVSLFQHLLQ